MCVSGTRVAVHVVMLKKPLCAAGAARRIAAYASITCMRNIYRTNDTSSLLYTHIGHRRCGTRTRFWIFFQEANMSRPTSRMELIT